MWYIFQAIATLSGLTLVIAGISAMSWLFLRLADVFVSLDREQWEKILIWVGSIVGVVALMNAGVNMVVPYSPHLPNDYPSVNIDVVTTLILLLLGFLLTLRPIKNAQWAAYVGLTIGVIMFAGIAFFWGSENLLNTWVASIVFTSMFFVYLALKFVEDLYRAIGTILTLPPVTLGMGLLAIVQGILVLVDLSLLMLFVS